MTLISSLRFLSDNKSKLSIISMILIIIISYSLFYYQEKIAEENIKNEMFLQQRDEQIESTKVMAEHISSDLKLIMSILQGLTDSIYLQQGELYGERIEKLFNEKFRDITAITKVDGLFIADSDDIMTYNIVSVGQRSFVNIDISFREYVQQVKSKLKPIFSDGYKGMDGKYKISLIAPIINREDGRYIGLIGVEIPSKDFFAHYGNINNINSSFLVAYDRNAKYIATPRAQLFGENFFGDKVQSFFNFNDIQNDYYRKVFANNLSEDFAVYNFGRGERLTTGQPILLQGEPSYFVFVISPTESIYSSIGQALFLERVKLFSLILAFTLAVIILIIFLVKWNRNLDKEVKHRTAQLEESNKALLSANEDLQKNDTMQKEFINVAAHELRTPTQSILNFSQLLSMHPEKQEQFIEGIQRNATRLQRLSSEILDVTKIESKSLKLDRELFNLNDLLSTVVNDYCTLIEDDGRQNIKLFSEPSKETLIVEADKERISQVISNLISNAIKFTKEGEIFVNAEKKDDRYAMVTVRDTGEGIDSGIFPKLFSKFITTSFQGIGLGLYISKNIIEAHGGKIWAENNNKDDRGGATFYFTIPLSNVTKQERELE
jgi:signal transduction histidine kinase